MLRWTTILLVITFIAAVFGYSDIATAASDIAKIIFYLSLATLVVSLLSGAFRQSS